MTTQAKQGVRQVKFAVPMVVERDTTGFHAYSPALKGLHMDGETEEEALENARLTAADFLEIMIREGIPIPLSILAQNDVNLVSESRRGYRTEEITINL